MTVGQRWVHTSGGQGTGVMEPVRLAGGRAAALARLALQHARRPGLQGDDAARVADVLDGA